MLDDAVVMATLPAQDLDRARAWYRDVLGLEPDAVLEGGTGLRYQLAGGRFFVFASRGRASGDHTQVSFTVADARATARQLIERGAVFEVDDDLDQVDGVADLGTVRSGWLRDSEGNLLGIVEER